MSWAGRANLSRSQLCDANLSRCDLREAYLYRASTKRTVLRGADLWAAQLPDVDLS